jgi:hypothetical protein
LHSAVRPRKDKAVVPPSLVAIPFVVDMNAARISAPWLGQPAAVDSTVAAAPRSPCAIASSASACRQRA